MIKVISIERDRSLFGASSMAVIRKKYHFFNGTHVFEIFTRTVDDQALCFSV